MTVSSTTNRAAYTGNGVTTSFSFPYYFLADSDLKVIKVTIAGGTESVQVLNTDYTVTGAANPAGGSVVMASAPSSSYSIVIYRDPPATQAVDLVENDPLPAETLEGAFDKAVMLIQRVRDIVTRSLRQPEGDATDISVMPAKATRASKYLAFDSDGNPVATAGTTSSVVISTFAETFLDDTSASAVRTTIGAVGLTGTETIAGDKTFNGTTTLGGPLRVAEAYRLDNTVSPSQITSDQNDYAPTGHGSATAFRVSTDAARSITGLAGGTSGREVRITNIGSFSVKLVDESSSSTAANRFALPYDITIPPDGTVQLRWDSTTSRWRAIGSTPFRESVVILTHDVADGTDGGTASTGAWTKLAGLAELKDTDGLCSVSSGAFTLAAGTWVIDTSKTFVGAVAGFRTKIRDTTNSADYALSLSGRHPTAGLNLVTAGTDEITVTAATTFEFQYFASSTSGTTDLGDDDGVTAGVERYAIVRCRRIRPAGG